MTENFHVVLVDLPCKIRGFVGHNSEDGSNTIVLNSRLNRETQIKCMMHEIEHIENDDFYSKYSSDEIEAKRHAKIKKP